jgi:starch-binding outer membrane protein, SusD/RagB family
MIMKKYNYIILISALIILMLGSCKKDWLEVPPEGQVTPEGYYSTQQRAEEIVNAVYNNMLQWDEHSFSWIGMSSITSDDADKGSSDGDTGADKDKMQNFTYSATDLSINEIWVANFRGISRANRAIDVLPDVAIETKLKHRLIAEARFLRAYFYFNLVRCYGGVPLVDKVIDPTDQEELARLNVRASVDDIYNLIIGDLTYAKDSLYSKTEYEAKDLGRATKGAAKGLLAKVYLYRKDFQKAHELTQDIINSGEYGLVSDYATIWREVGENSEESLFEAQAVGAPIGLGVQQYTVVQGVRGQFGWGFNVPSEDLKNAYEPGDPRLDATFIFPGDTMWDGTVIIENCPNPDYNEKAYISKTQESYNGNDDQTNKNLRILRYAEILLIDAETANELGDAAGAKESLNKVRTRVGLPDVTDSDQTILRNKIWKERRVELAMEHDRFFDLVRQGRAAQVLGPLGFTAGKNELFPVPQAQIDVSGGTLIQNPGY